MAHVVSSPLLFVFLFLKCILAQEGTYCRTPLQDPGVCINIKQCEGLVMLLRTQSSNPEVRSYLIRSTCGYVGSVPLVCCPRITSQFDTTTTSTNPPVVPDVTSVPDTRGPIGTGKVQLANFKDTCGISNGTISRVVGGTPASLGEFSWAVAIGYTNPKNPDQYKWLCGGSLITDRHILTAAHCVQGRTDLAVGRIGDLDIFSEDDNQYAETIPIVKAAVHEQYNPSELTNDIAILTFGHSPNPNNIVPICLPLDEPFRSTSTRANRQVFIAGWGAISYKGQTSSSLLKAQLPIVANSACKEKFDSINAKTTIDDRVLCAGTGSKDSCQGDSGGPLMAGTPGKQGVVKFYQIGLVSYGYKCAEPGFSGVYTKMSSFLDWIENHLD